MRPGWNPTRRNRNQGTAKRGRGQENRLVVPKYWPDDRMFWEVLRSPIAVSRTVANSELVFLVEPPRSGSFHACTIEDVCRVLACAPPEHLNGIDLLVLRQPTRKQEVLRPVWGRLAYHAAIGRYSGTAIYLEAQTIRSLRWPASLTPEDEAELDRLRGDGHVVTRERRGFTVAVTPEAIRATQLYRTLLHELGHYVDWLESVVRPIQEMSDDFERDRVVRTYRSKDPRTKEDFAHRYALEVGGRVPRFARSLDHELVRRDGMDPAWFQVPA